MTVKTGQTWAGLFVTLDATGAASAADSTPTGTLYVDGVSDAATVTITGSNPYKFAVTLPTLTAGQRVDMYIAATIDTIATAGIVASAQADTVLLSDGVTLADDAITASKFDESTAYPLKSADTGTTAVARVGADSDTLETLSDEIAAVKAETAAIQADLDNPDQYKNDLSGMMDGMATLATAADLATIENEVDVISGIVDAIKAKTDNLPADPADDSDIDAQLAAIKAETAAILVDTGTTIPATLAGLATSTEVSAIAMLDEVVIGTYTVQDILKILAAKTVGKATGGGTTTITYRGLDDTSNVIVETVDANGNRSAVTLTV